MGIIRGRSRYRKGDHNSLSDFSGQKYKRSAMRLTWDGKLVGKNEWEKKETQLIIRPRIDRPAITDQTRTDDQDEVLLDTPFFPGSGFATAFANVLDSDQNSFTTSNTVINSSGSSFNVNPIVLDSDGNEFEVFS